MDTFYKILNDSDLILKILFVFGKNLLYITMSIVVINLLMQFNAICFIKLIIIAVIIS